MLRVGRLYRDRNISTAHNERAHQDAKLVMDKHSTNMGDDVYEALVILRHNSDFMKMCRQIQPTLAPYVAARLKKKLKALADDVNFCSLIIIYK